MKNLKVILLSILAGFINGMFSTGAGLILIPALVFMLEYDEYVARGTALVIIMVLCLINLIIYSQEYIFETYMIPIILGGLVGTFIGSKLIYKINRKILSVIFAIFTIVMGIGMIK